MRRWLLIAFLLLFSAPLLLAQKEDWLPITSEDLQMKEAPADPGAPAVLLYYAHYIDESAFYQFVYRRIKILQEEGNRYANVEIELGPFATLTDLKARTIRPNGSIVEFTGKPFDKVVYRSRDIKFQAKSFIIPEAEVGSIIEFKYKLSSFSDQWVLQHDLYTVRESFSLRANPALGGTTSVTGLTGGRLAWVTLHMKKSEQPVRNGHVVEFETQNVPAFRREPHMPPEDYYKPSVRFFHIDAEVSTADQFWDGVGKRFAGYVERFIGNTNEVNQVALEAVGNETDAEQKLRKLYERAQKVRNLGFERRLSAEERKKEGIKDNENVGDIVKRGYAHSWEIARLFVAMARAAGFDASIILVSSRRTRFFAKEVLSSRQFDTEMALV